MLINNTCYTKIKLQYDCLILTFSGSQDKASFLYVCFKPSTVMSSKDTPNIDAASSNFMILAALIQFNTQ